MKYKDQIAVLIVSDPEPNDSAYYRCEASNKIGRCETQACLTVHCE